MADVVERLRRAVMSGEDGCGTLPAKESVKVRPADWHAITRLAREATSEIEALRARLSQAGAGGVVWFGFDESTGEFTGEYSTVKPHDTRGMVPFVRAAAGGPVAWVIPGDDNARDDGSIDAMAWQEGEFTRPLYATPPAPVQTASVEAVRDKLRAAVLRGTADEINGKPADDIIVKGCEAAEYVHPEDAASTFVDCIVDEVLASLTAPTQGDVANILASMAGGKPEDYADMILSSPSPAGGVREALEEAEKTLRLVERPAFEDPQYGAEVKALGERIGFGALMSSASASWRKRLEADGLAGGEFVSGPCHSTVVSALSTIRAALSAPATGEVVDWQPISTARKKHGDRVLLALPNGTVKEGYWGTGRYDRAAKAYRSAWVVGPGLEVEPTQWREIPAHPTPTAPADGGENG